MDEEKYEVDRPKLSSTPTGRKGFATPVSMQGTDKLCDYCQLPCKNDASNVFLNINKEVTCTTVAGRIYRRARHLLSNAKGQYFLIEVSVRSLSFLVHVVPNLLNVGRRRRPRSSSNC